MKLSQVALLFFVSAPALAADSFTCSGHGETVTVSQTRFDQTLTHNGHLFKSCKRSQWNERKVVFECEDGGIDHSVQLFVDLRNGRAVSAGLGYIIGGSSYGGEEDGSTIDLTCRD